MRIPDYRRLLSSAAITLFAALLVLAVSGTTFFGDVSAWTYDYVVNHSWHKADPAVTNKVVVVDFDDKTFASVKQYPIPRRYIADVLNHVAAGNPRVVGIDIFLSENRTPEEDRVLATALSNAGNVIIASQAATGGLPATLPTTPFCEAEDPAAVSGFCKEGSGGAMGYAAVNLPIDSDGFIRRSTLFVGDKDPAISFSVSLAQQYTGQAIAPAGPHRAELAGKSVPYADEQRRSVLIGAWPADGAQVVSAADVLSPGFNAPQHFADKVVILGQGSDAARDRHFTPVFRRSTTSGVRTRLGGAEVHAAGVRTLLGGLAIAPATSNAIWLTTALLTLLFLIAFRAVPVRFAFPVLLAALLLVYAASQIIFDTARMWLPLMFPVLGIIFAAPLALAFDFVQERFLKSAALREKEQAFSIFSRYVSPEVAQEIWSRRDEVVLAGEERDCTVVFTDIRSFTAITAGKPSQTVVRWLNEYLTDMDAVIRAHGGFLNKFIGDGIMVLFGVPLSQGARQDALRAVRCCAAMVEAVAEMNRRHAGENGFPKLKIGAGVHTGKLTAGNIGSPDRLEYSVIGETVNLASRLESLTKELHADIVMSHTTYAHVTEEFSARDAGEIPVRGFDEPIRLYALTVAVPIPATTVGEPAEAHR